MPIRFPCDECDKPLKVNDKYAGKRVVCPACQAVVRVPEAEQEEKEAPARPVKKAARATVRAKQSPAEELEEDEEELDEDEQEEPEPPRTKTKKRPDRRREPEPEPEEEPEPAQEEERSSTEAPDEEEQEEEPSSPAVDDTEDVIEGKLEEPVEDDEIEQERTEQIEELEELGPPLRKGRRRRDSASQAATFGLASIAFGVLGVALFWSRFFGLPLAGFGFVLGILGLLLGIRAREGLSRLSLIGAAASVVAVLLCLLTGLRAPDRSALAVESRKAGQEVKAPGPPPPSTPLAIAPSKPKPPPVPDAQQLEFRTRMLAFVEEASALAELAQVQPSAADFGKKVDALTESFSRIPDSPDSMEAFNKARTIAHQVWADFRGCRQIVELADRVKQYGGDDAYKQALGKLKELAKIQKTRLEQIRVLVGQKDAAGGDQPGNG